MGFICFSTNNFDTIRPRSRASIQVLNSNSKLKHSLQDDSTFTAPRSNNTVAVVNKRSSITTRRSSMLVPQPSKRISKLNISGPSNFVHKATMNQFDYLNSASENPTTKPLAKRQSLIKRKDPPPITASLIRSIQPPNHFQLESTKIDENIVLDETEEVRDEELRLLPPTEPISKFNLSNLFNPIDESSSTPRSPLHQTSAESIQASDEAAVVPLREPRIEGGTGRWNSALIDIENALR